MHAVPQIHAHHLTAVLRPVRAAGCEARAGAGVRLSLGVRVPETVQGAGGSRSAAEDTGAYAWRLRLAGGRAGGLRPGSLHVWVLGGTAVGTFAMEHESSTAGFRRL